MAKKKIVEAELVGDEVIEDETEIFLFKNKGLENLFTEDGKCAPNYEVLLTAKQAKKYSGLVKI